MTNKTYDKTGVLRVIGQEKHSRNGNPRYRAILQTKEGDSIELLTLPDSGIAYSLKQFEDMTVMVQIGNYHNRECIYSIELVDKLLNELILNHNDILRWREPIEK